MAAKVDLHRNNERIKLSPVEIPVNILNRPEAGMLKMRSSFLSDPMTKLTGQISVLARTETPPNL